MSGHLLTLNAGSSSVKYAVFGRDATDAAPVLQGQVDGIGVAGGDARTHDDALADILGQLRSRAVHIQAVGHRIVHGGTGFGRPVRIDDTVVDKIQALAPLAPLHQPHNLAGVRAARRAFADVVQVACFDTAFHHQQPELHSRFALPQHLFDAGIRRYGFHGLSYESILAQLMATDAAQARRRIVVAHLGNGSSMCAMHQGRPVATTMSFSPLDGLPMGTRCGRLDAAVVLFLIQQQGKTPEQVAQLLYRESGLLGLSGISSDMRAIEQSTLPAAAMAIDYFVEHALRELAGMAAALRGIDLLVFTGGIGENAHGIRQRIVEGAAWLGAFETRVLHTNEEAMIARHTAALA